MRLKTVLLSVHAFFIRLHFAQISLCGPTYACVSSFEYQATRYVSDNHRLILWRGLVLTGPYTAELTTLHKTLLKMKEENEFKIV